MGGLHKQTAWAQLITWQARQRLLRRRSALTSVEETFQPVLVVKGLCALPRGGPACAHVMMTLGPPQCLETHELVGGGFWTRE